MFSLLRALGKVSARHVQSFGSIGGQNLILFVGFVALQPSSAEFFIVLLLAVLLFPLSTDPMQAVPEDRRATWPIREWQWLVLRAASMLLSPVTWIGIALIARFGWQTGVYALGVGIFTQFATLAAKRLPRLANVNWLRWIPAPRGVTGAIMRLQWRGMLRTLDPYVALALAGSTVVYRLTGLPLDPAAPRIMALVTALALSTHTQVLLGIDGHGAERYSLMPIRGWHVLLSKDLAFLALLTPLVAPLDFPAGVMGGFAALVVGHFQSVHKPAPQVPWRFTAGALIPVGVIQIIALFSVGNSVSTQGWPVIAGCLAAWLVSLFFCGWQWDRRKRA